MEEPSMMRDKRDGVKGCRTSRSGKKEIGRAPTILSGRGHYQEGESKPSQRSVRLGSG